VNFTPVTRLTVFYEPEEGRRQVVGRLLRRRHELLFEFEGAFLATGLSLSPIKLPLRAGVVRGDPTRFDGLMGLFDDSLPDGWGRLLIDRRARQQGYAAAQLGPLDRLSLVGSHAMGALVYEPEQLREQPTVVRLKQLEQEISTVLADGNRADFERLFLIGGSPHGARPKALVQMDAQGALHAGATRALSGCTPWMVKFRSQRDAPASGSVEHAYFLMARAAGVNVPPTRVLGPSPGYFAIRRFDREGARKIHQLTLAGLLEAPHTSPSLTYEDLLLATRYLVRAEPAVAEMFRRACFNVFAHNRDDHSKNFSFLMSERGEWSPSPAYDLSFSEGPGGEHWMLVAGEGANPGRTHLATLARKGDVKRPGPIIDEVRAAVDRFAFFADEAGVPSKTRQQIATTLGVPTRSTRRKRSR
jgi:serine/threonine-protein kinase HipA